MALLLIWEMKHADVPGMMVHGLALDSKAVVIGQCWGEGQDDAIPPTPPGPCSNGSRRLEGLRTSQPATHYPLKVGTASGPCPSLSRYTGIFTESPLCVCVNGHVAEAKENRRWLSCLQTWRLKRFISYKRPSYVNEVVEWMATEICSHGTCLRLLLGNEPCAQMTNVCQAGQVHKGGAHTWRGPQFREIWLLLTGSTEAGEWCSSLCVPMCQWWWPGSLLLPLPCACPGSLLWLLNLKASWMRRAGKPSLPPPRAPCDTDQSASSFIVCNCNPGSSFRLQF